MSELQSRWAESHVCDLLLSGNLASTRNDRVMLNAHLAGLGYKVDDAVDDQGKFGRKTEAAVIDFLSKGHQDLIPRVKITFDNNDGWDNFTTSRNINPVDSSKPRDINSFLTQKTPLSTEEMKQLQAQLKTQPDGGMGLNTAKKIISHLHFNPSVFENINPAILKQLAARQDVQQGEIRGSEDRYNSKRELAEACRNSPQYMVLTKTLLSDVEKGGATKSEVYNLQTVLKAGGFYTGHIDGTLGPDTQKGIFNFNSALGRSFNSNALGETPSFKITIDGPPSPVSDTPAIVFNPMGAKP